MQVVPADPARVRCQEERHLLFPGRARLSDAARVPSLWVYVSEVEARDIDILAVGDYLQLPATPAGGFDALQSLFTGTKALADYMSCAQGAPPGVQVSQLAGVIERIDAITALERRIPIGPTADLIEPEVGTAKRQPVRRLGDGWTDPDAPRQLVGYLVWLHEG